MVSTTARTLAVIAVLFAAGPAGDVALTGSWRALSADALSCDQPAPVRVRDFVFEIEHAPHPMRVAASFSFKDADVTGRVSFNVGPDGTVMRRPLAGVSGLLIGQIVRTGPAGTDSAGLMLQGFLVSREQYDAWTRNKSGQPPGDFGEVALRFDESPLHPIFLSGVIRSADLCAATATVPSPGNRPPSFGRGATARWSARVMLQQLR